MGEHEEYTETTTAIGARAGCLAQTVALYGRKGLVDHVVTSNGLMLFKASAANEVRRIKAERLKSRGGWRRLIA